MGYCEHMWEGVTDCPECSPQYERNRIKELEAENERLKRMIWNAAHSFQDNWAIDWTPLIQVKEEYDNKVVDELTASEEGEG